MLAKSYTMSKAGSMSNLKIKEEEIGSPMQGEVQIEVKSIGLNFADILRCTVCIVQRQKGVSFQGWNSQG
jgi:NADPH:quinone reductase-like Zn-dependent oxidoreductase